MHRFQKDFLDFMPHMYVLTFLTKVMEIYVLVGGHVVRREETVEETCLVGSATLLPVVDEDLGGVTCLVRRTDMETASFGNAPTIVDRQT